MDELQMAQATRPELARGAREHYERVSMASCDWYSLIPHAIDAWEREPELEALSEKWAKKCADTEAQRVGLTIKAETMRAALERIAGGCDYPTGIQGAPEWYAAVDWAQGIAREALDGWKI